MNRFKLMALAAVSVPFVAGQAFAAGYEKSIMWGGRTAGVAGISTPYIMGSQALYFNPAGLVSDNVGQDVSFNISPNWSQFEGPINDNNDVVKSKQQMTTPFGLIYGATLNDKIGFGVGGFVSGGSKAVYENVDFTGPFAAFSSDVKTDLVIAEFSAGVGYKVNEALKLGAAYRYTFASANFALANRGSGTIASVKLTDLKDEDTSGFRVGAQYKATDRMLVGLTYRSSVDFEAKGKMAYSIFGSISQDDVDASAKTTLPQQVTLGVQHNYETWRALAEYAWTEYSKVQNITISAPGATAPLLRAVEVQQEWKDQHNIRLGGEYLAMVWPIRVGYGWTSQVTNTDYPRASFTPPGQAHTLTLGTGMTWDVMGMPLQYDIAGEYTMASGTGGTAEAGDTTDNFRKGDYSATSYGVHVGLTYAF
jgi:long-subunit fatty acid transport protein